MKKMPSIAILAETPAQGRYLGDIARLAGFSDMAETDVITLRQSVGVLSITGDFFEPVTMSLPVRAAALLRALEKITAPQNTQPQKMMVKDGVFDLAEGFWIRTDNAPIRLTEKEVAILQVLIEAGEVPVSRQAMLDKVWAYAQGVETHTLETHIYRLRQKIERDPAMPEILVTQDLGYVLCPRQDG